VSSPTAALLWAACRREPSAGEVTDAITRGADLDLAAEIAVVERVSPLLWRALRHAGVETNGQGWATVLSQDAARCRAQSRLTLPRMATLALGPLADAGLEALVIKGGAVAGRYPDTALRPMDDIDLILPPDQIEPAVDTLTQTGWVRYVAPARRRHEVDLMHPALPGLPIDLHRGLSTWRSRANRLTSEQLWAQRQKTTLHGVGAFVLPPEPELVMLAAHAAKPFHIFARLVWTADIAMVVAAAEPRGGIDWDQVQRLADATKCRTAVAVALSQAEFLGVQSPAVLRRIEGRARQSALKPVLSPEWPVEKGDRHIRSEIQYALVDDRLARATLVVSEILSKRVRDVPRRAAVLAHRRVRRTWRSLRGHPDD
jgi:hypothetical protein